MLLNAGHVSLLPAYAALDRAAPQLYAHIRRVLQQPLQKWGQGAISPNYLFLNHPKIVMPGIACVPHDRLKLCRALQQAGSVSSSGRHAADSVK